MSAQGEYVSKIPHKVSVVDALAVKRVPHDLLVLRSKLISNGLLNIVSNVDDGSGAVGAASACRLPNVQIKIVEVPNRVDDARG